MSLTIGQLSETRRQILLAVKRNGSLNAAELASYLDISSEGIRQHLLALEKQGFLERHMNRSTNPVGGRPSFKYALTPDGENLFPKHYDEFASDLIEAIEDKHGTEALSVILSQIAEKRMNGCKEKFEGLTFMEKLDALKDFYQTHDPFMEFNQDENGITLTEYNCPVSNIAKKYPMVCGATATTLTNLLGVKVIREKPLQNNGSCCVFRILQNEPVE